MARIEIRTNYEPIEKYLEREEVPEGIKEILRKTPEKYNAVCATILLHKDNAWILGVVENDDENEIPYLIKEFPSDHPKWYLMRREIGFRTWKEFGEYVAKLKSVSPKKKIIIH
jgi:hypothetical protein